MAQIACSAKGERRRTAKQRTSLNILKDTHKFEIGKITDGLSGSQRTIHLIPKSCPSNMLFSTQIARLFGLAALTALAAESDIQSPLMKGTRKPNVVFFLTDDQDVHLESLSYQPLVKKHLIDKGLTYQHHFCTVALCCPSRVNLWTGKAAHNTNVTDVNPPYGKRPW